jgi:transposase
MNQIAPQNRLQVQMVSLEDAISATNPVRLIDLFVHKLDLERLGFEVRPPRSEGRPAFDERVFLALYLYGYQNGVRSSRALARECTRNLEVRWLLGEQSPNYHTIADFRKRNTQALRQMFRLFVDFLRHANLLGGHTVAIDGTKVRGNNSRKNNHSAQKIARHIARIDAQTEAYLNTLDDTDRLEAQERPPRFSDEKLDELRQKRLRYEVLGQTLAQSGDTQLSTTDPDARALPVRGTEVAVGYNVQAAVDSKHNLVVAEDTLNRSDRNALHPMAKASKQNMQAQNLTALADKGYHNAQQLQHCADEGIATLCAPPEVTNSNAKGTTEEYMVDKFYYDTPTDTYICPAGHRLSSSGTLHTKKREGANSYRYKKYRTTACKTCRFKAHCTARPDGREIERSEYADAVEANHIRYHQNPQLYRQRQMMNEHIFGTIKRKWGYYYTDLRGLQKVRGEMALIFMVYNFKRCITILGMKNMLEKLKNWQPDYTPLGPNGPCWLKNALLGFIRMLLGPSLKLAA